ncbi:MAG: PfkB family carbohydrate kinase [Bacilli bacterium]|nr:PfkB family carbohydrate kinase [Bacilli bacterium]
MKKIVCIGHASYDITFPVDGYPNENSKNRVPEKIECGGGPASNAAYLLGKWGMNTSFIGVVGNDLYGKRILKEFEQVKVDTKQVEIDNEYETTLSFIVVNKNNGSRTTFTYRNKEMKMRNQIKVEADIILVDGQELDTSIKAIKDNPKAISIIDAGSLKEENIILGKMVNYLVCSKDFAEDFCEMKINLQEPDSTIKVFQKLKQEFNNNIIITLEAKGCLYEKDNIIKLMPSIKVKSIDSTGAGDLFHGAFVYGIANGFDIEKTLKIANITGALSVTRLGGRYSVFSLEEVLKVYNEYTK